ncbi:MAG: putative Zn-dependent protease [Sphingobacteriales bacterium]|jgi:predicted Zn-dependent protease
MSQQLALQGGGMTLQVLLAQEPAMTQALLLQSYGVAVTLGSLKYSRTHETEADKMDLVFMAMAGYDPQAAPVFWGRMSANRGGQQPEFLSTHPHDDTRIKDLKEFMPEALK